MDIKLSKVSHFVTLVTFVVTISIIILSSYLSHVFKIVSLFLISLQFVIFYISRFDLNSHGITKSYKDVRNVKHILMISAFLVLVSLFLIKAFFVNGVARLPEIGQSLDPKAFFILFMTVIICLMFLRKRED